MTKTKYWLLIILFIATLLRLIGIYPGYNPFHSDENFMYGSVVNMYKNNSVEPIRYEYPALSPIVVFFFFKVIYVPLSWLFFFVNHLTEFIDGYLKLPLSKIVYDRIILQNIIGPREVYVLFLSRFVTALFGIAVVLMGYYLGSISESKRTGLIASLLIAINYRQVLNSHFALPDIYNAFFLLSSFLATIRIMSHSTQKNVLVAIVLASISSTTKYQIFAFIPLVAILLYKKNWKNLLLIPLLALPIFLITNPFLIKNYSTFLSQIKYASLKYRTGRMSFDFYPYSYLYHYGIGKITSIIILIGIALAIIKKNHRLLLSLTFILPFFFFLTVYTGGGFYTRNFVSITPILLVFASYTISKLFRGNKFVKFLAVLITLFAVIENFANSIVVPVQYSKQWNHLAVGDWLNSHLDQNSKIAAHSSVPFSDSKFTRIPYDLNPDSAFSESEFSREGANYAVSNLDWSTTEFYWWMTEDSQTSLRYWHKPNFILNDSFPSLALQELSDYSIYTQIKPWQTPESNFLVSLVPKFSVENKLLMKKYSFDNNPDEWIKAGLFGDKDNNLRYESGKLIIDQKKIRLPSFHWLSPPISVSNWPGLEIDYTIKSTGNKPNAFDGLVYVSFYKTLADAISNINRLAVRLGPRNGLSGSWTNQKITSIIGSNAQFITLSFMSEYSTFTTIELDSVSLYQANVKSLYNQDLIKPVKLDDNILYPISHGNL